MNVFEEVKARVSIRRAVEASGVKVNRRGQFICPFHYDTHPSASIKDDYFNCFVCGAGGDCISYTAKLYGLSNFDAVRKLNDEFSLMLNLDREYTKYEKMSIKCSSDTLKSTKGSIETREQEIIDFGNDLAEVFKFLWRCKNWLPHDDENHVYALQNFTIIEYYCECYDNDPGEFIERRKEVEWIKRFASSIKEQKDNERDLFEQYL